MTRDLSKRLSLTDMCWQSLVLLTSQVVAWLSPIKLYPLGPMGQEPVRGNFTWQVEPSTKLLLLHFMEEPGKIEDSGFFRFAGGLLLISHLCELRLFFFITPLCNLNICKCAIAYCWRVPLRHSKKYVRQKKKICKGTSAWSYLSLSEKCRNFSTMIRLWPL